MTYLRHSRRAFTLIELLTVMSLIAVLGAMGVYFLPSMGDSARAARGAGSLQSWLQIARTRALRDGVPTGLRMISANPGKFQYIAQPDDYAVGQAVLSAPGALDVSFTDPCDLLGTNGDNVVAGDFIEFLGSGVVHKIGAVTGPKSLKLVSNSSPPFSAITIAASGINYAGSTTPIPNYRIIRQARVSDDEVLDLPSGIIIEMSKSVQMPSGTGIPGPFDVLFSPSGAVITPGVEDKIAFWVRDGARQNVTDGEPTLIVVYSRSGLTAAYPVVPTAGSEYSLVK